MEDHVVHCTMCIVRRTLYDVYCTAYNVRRTCRLYAAHGTPFFSHVTSSAHVLVVVEVVMMLRKLYVVHFMSYIVYRILHVGIDCTMYYVLTWN